MRILFVAPRLPLPADTGGKIRMWNLLKRIARFARVDLVCFSFERDDDKNAQELKQCGISVSLVKAPPGNFLKKLLFVLFHPRPYAVVKYARPLMRQKIKKLLSQRKYDLIYADHIHMATYRPLFGGIPVWVDEHNVEFRILERCAAVEKSFVKKFIYQNQAGKMKRFESRALRNVRACAAVSAPDALLLRELAGNETPVYVIPNGVDTQFYKISSDSAQDRQDTRHKAQEDSLVFTGSMDWLPNDDAALYFIRDILPLVWRQNPSVKFYAVGKNPSPELQRYGRENKNIIVTGLVDDVRPYIKKSGIFVVPLRIGGGTRLKILEAMSMEKAVVSTAIGAEGIDCRDGVDVVIAKTPGEFAREVNALLGAPQRRRVLGRNGRDLVLAAYDWTVVGAKIQNIYEKLIRNEVQPSES